MLEFGKPKNKPPSGQHATVDAGPLSGQHRDESKWGRGSEANPKLCSASQVSVLQKSAGQTATRSLSATVRKKTSSSLDDPPSLQDMAKLLDAVRAENAMVDGAPRNPKEGEVGGGRKDESVLESRANASHAGADLKHKSNAQALPGIQSGVSSTSSPRAVRLNSDHKESVSSSRCEKLVSQPVNKLPIKPTLLSYNISASPPKFDVKPTSTAQKSEQVGGASNQTLELERGGEKDMASQSLTAHTLKIITEKVRNMDPRYV